MSELQSALCLDPVRLRYDALIGTGGIGAGIFFALNGNHTLGREESRSGRLLNRQDYCKLHIIVHYVRVLLGQGFVVLPIGSVGDDELGCRLRGEMAEVGLDLRYVRTNPDRPTLYAICLLYPDGSGGNLTTDDSASAQVSPILVRAAAGDCARYARRGIALAVPEVPLAARAELLSLATQHGLLRVASFTTEEIPAALEQGLLAQVDLLALNADEAARLAGLSDGDSAAADIVVAALARLLQIQPALQATITAGRLGSWAWDGRRLSHCPAHPVAVAGTAGAGDAHLAGVLAGLTAGLALAEAQGLGGLAAAVSVTSEHTINKGLDRQALHRLAASTKVPVSPGVRRLLADG
jgi:ribokinase